jgi:hypothetical protein
MPRIRVPLSNFQFGEVSPSLITRTDTNVYINAAQRLENFFIKNEGGILKRFGTKAIYEFDTVPDLNNKVQQHRLVPFIFSDDERYIVSLENAKIRCFQISPTTGNVSLVSTVTQDVDGDALPFTDSILHEVTYAQSGDVMFISHNSFQTRELRRTSLTDFEVSSFLFETSSDGNTTFQPYYSFQETGVTLDPSASTGNNITLTTSSNYFDTTGTQTGGNYPDSKHIGVVLKYAKTEIEIKSVQSATQATGDIFGTIQIDLDIDAFRSVDGTADLEVTHIEHGLKVGDTIEISRAGSIAGITAGSINGSRNVQEVIDANHYFITAGTNANASIDGGGAPRITTHAPTINWKEQSYSSYRGFPAAVTFHENRLWFGGTVGQPDGIWASRSSEYFNFDVGDAEDNDALDLTASIGEINAIRHIVSNRDLQIFTSTSEFYIPSLLNEPITATNAQIKRQTPFGSSFVRPLSYDGATIYVQKNGSVVREYLFSDAEAAYVSSAVSTLSPHLIKSPIQMSVLNGALNRPETFMFAVNLDGTMALFASNRGEKRAGWTEFTSTGKFHSVVTIDDRVFVVMVFDKGDGVERFYLLEFEPRFNLDFSNSYTGTAGVFDVSDYFVDGSMVDVVEGSDYYGNVMVKDPSATAQITTTSLSVVTFYKANGTAFSEQPVEVSVGGGNSTFTITFSSLQADNANIYAEASFGGVTTTIPSSSVTVSATGAILDLTKINNALTTVEVGYKFNVNAETMPIDGIIQGGPLTGQPRSVYKVVVDVLDTFSIKVNNDSLILRQVTDDFSNDRVAATGKKEFRFLGYDKDPSIKISQNYPLKLEVNGLIAEVSF